MYFFAYGTLKDGFENPIKGELVNLLYNPVAGRMRGKLFLVAPWYPGAVDTPDDATIEGDLYQIQDEKELFRILDPYEDFDPAHPETSLYIRTKRMVETVDGAREAWVYLYQRPVDPSSRIVDGNFTEADRKRGPRGL